MAPMLAWLEARLDMRLAATFVSGITGRLAWSGATAPMDCATSGFGVYVLDPAHVPAGTQQLSTNVHRSPQWAAADLITALWQQAAAGTRQVTEMARRHAATYRE